MTAEAGEDDQMTKAIVDASTEREAKRGEAAWKEHRDAISDRNVAAHERGSAERKVALGRVFEQRRIDARHESELLGAINLKLEKANTRRISAAKRKKRPDSC